MTEVYECAQNMFRKENSLTNLFLKLTHIDSAISNINYLNFFLFTKKKLELFSELHIHFAPSSSFGLKPNKARGFLSHTFSPSAPELFLAKADWLFEWLLCRPPHADSLIPFFDILLVTLFFQYLLVGFNRPVSDCSKEYLSAHFHLFRRSPDVFASTFTNPLRPQVSLNKSFVLDLKLRLAADYRRFKARFVREFAQRFLGKTDRSERDSLAGSNWSMRSEPAKGEVTRAGGLDRRRRTRHEPVRGREVLQSRALEVVCSFELDRSRSQNEEHDQLQLHRRRVPLSAPRA